MSDRRDNTFIHLKVNINSFKSKLFCIHTFSQQKLVLNYFKGDWCTKSVTYKIWYVIELKNSPFTPMNVATLNAIQKNILISF